MASAPTRPLVALSSDGKTLAHIPASAGGEVAAAILRVLLFQVDNGTLKTTLTHRNRPEDTLVLSNPLKLLFASPELLTVAFSDQIMTWDLNRGVVSYKIKAKTGQVFHDVCVPSETKSNNSLYILVSAEETGKVQIHQYNASTGKIERKVKAGKGGGACGLAVTSEYLIVRHEDQIRVLAQADGQKVSKCGSLTEVNAGDQNIAVAKNVMATICQGQVVLMNIQNGKKIVSIPLDKTSTTSNRSSFELWKHNDQNLILLEGEKVRQLSLASGEVAKTLSCSYDGSLERQYRVGQGNHLVALLLKNGQYQIQSEAISESNDEIDLSWKNPEDEKKKEDKDQKQNQKRKQNSSVLGPGQVGGEALISEGPVSKKSKVASSGKDEDDAEEDEPTVGERLLLLQQTLDGEVDDDEDEKGDVAMKDRDDEDSDGSEDNDSEQDESEEALAKAYGFSPKRATTESLGKLLEQGLQSGEDRMIELALAVGDRQILHRTCEELSDSLLPGLMNALTSRIAAKSGRAEHLCLWLSVLLRTGRIRSIAHLQPLRNLIQERVEVFPDLLRLQGRVNLMTEMIE